MLVPKSDNCRVRLNAEHMYITTQLATTSWQLCRTLQTPRILSHFWRGIRARTSGSAEGVDGIFPKLQAFRRTELRPLRLQIRGIDLESLVGLQAVGSKRRRGNTRDSSGRIPTESQKLVGCRILLMYMKMKSMHYYRPISLPPSGRIQDARSCLDRLRRCSVFM